MTKYFFSDGNQNSFLCLSTSNSFFLLNAWNLQVFFCRWRCFSTKWNSTSYFVVTQIIIQKLVSIMTTAFYEAWQSVKSRQRGTLGYTQDEIKLEEMNDVNILLQKKTITSSILHQYFSILHRLLEIKIHTSGIQ